MVSAVIKGTDSDRIPRGNVLLRVRVIEHKRKLRVKQTEHVRAELLIHRQDDLAVRITFKRIPVLFQDLPHPPESIQLTITDHCGTFQRKGLHTLR